MCGRSSIPFRNAIFIPPVLVFGVPNPRFSAVFRPVRRFQSRGGVPYPTPEKKAAHSGDSGFFFSMVGGRFDSVEVVEAERIFLEPQRFLRFHEWNSRGEKVEVRPPCATLFPLCRSGKNLAPQRLLDFRPQRPPFSAHLIQNLPRPVFPQAEPLPLQGSVAGRSGLFLIGNRCGRCHIPVFHSSSTDKKFAPTKKVGAVSYSGTLLVPLIIYDKNSNSRKSQDSRKTMNGTVQRD